MAHTHPGSDPDHIGLNTFQDEVTDRILNEAGRTLGRVFADMVNLLNPQAVVLGGRLGTAGPALIRGVEASLQRWAQPATAAAAKVVPALLGERAELTGALQLAAALAARRNASD
ncbi:MAG TPA: ROK family protein [Dermatophilaceae bacterium]|nr:ROK family protein [Dermatophilaceae bacterium]